MPRIQNEHTATSHFRPAGNFWSVLRSRMKSTLWMFFTEARFGLACALLISGVQWLARTTSIVELILNAVALGGILDWVGAVHGCETFFSIGMFWKGLQTQPVHIEHCVSYMLNFIWYGTFTVFINHVEIILRFNTSLPLEHCGGWKFSLQDIDEFLFVAMVPTKIQMAIQKLEPIKAISWAIWGEGLLEVMFIGVHRCHEYDRYDDRVHG